MFDTVSHQASVLYIYNPVNSKLRASWNFQNSSVREISEGGFFALINKSNFPSFIPHECSEKLVILTFVNGAPNIGQASTIFLSVCSETRLLVRFYGSYRRFRQCAPSNESHSSGPSRNRVNDRSTRVNFWASLHRFASAPSQLS